MRGYAPGKSMVPLLSASTSLIMSCSSDSEGFWPRERITVPSSLVVIWPGHQVSFEFSHGGNMCRHGRRRCWKTYHRHPCPMDGISKHWIVQRGRVLTKREKASRNSETCSSVSESAYIAISIDRPLVYCLAHPRRDLHMSRLQRRGERTMMWGRSRRKSRGRSVCVGSWYRDEM